MNGEEAKALRSHLLDFAAKSSTLTSKLLTYDGQQFEVRQLSLRDRKAIQKEAEDKKKDLNVLVAMHSTYVPGTDLRLFEGLDGEMVLLNQGSGGLTDCLAETMNDLILEAKAKGKPLASEPKT